MRPFKILVMDLLIFSESRKKKIEEKKAELLEKTRTELWTATYLDTRHITCILCIILCTYQSCVYRVVRQMIGWINIILYSNISEKRDGVNGFGQILPYFVFLIAI